MLVSEDMGERRMRRIVLGVALLVGLMPATPAWADSGAWLAPVDVSPPGSGGNFPQIAVAADGTAIAAWEDMDAMNRSIIDVAVRTAAGAWSAPEQLSAPPQYYFEDAYAPRIAFAPDGSAMIAWSRANSTWTYVVQAAVRPANGSWQQPVDVSSASPTALGQGAWIGDLVTATDGTATAAWSRFDGAHTIVQVASRPPGGAWTTAVDVSAAGQDAWAVRLGISSDGTATAAWERSNGSNTIIQAASDRKSVV
jgi:hypothetical protein